MPIAAGETVTLSLPGFTGPDFDSLRVQGAIASLAASSNVSWDASQMLLTFMMRDDVPQGIVAEFVISPSAGLRLPAVGIRVDQTDLTIATNAVLGPVPATTLITFDPVGFFPQTNLTFLAPAVANQWSNLTYSFVAAMDLVVNDTISLSLPGFGGASLTYSCRGQATGVLEVDPSCAIEAALWNAQTQILRLRVGAAVAAGLRVEVNLKSPSALYGVRLPAVGVRHDDRRYVVSSSAVEGPVLPISITKVQGVGAFIGEMTSLSFAPGKASESGNMTFTFAAHMPMNSGDEVVVSLPGFAGPSQAAIDLIQNNASFSTAAWDSASSTLSLVLVAPISPLTQIVVVLLDTQISLPEHGVRIVGSGVTIETNAALGPVLPLTIVQIQAVGFFDQTRLSFGSDPRAGQPADFELSFVPQMNLLVGDSITVKLPDFTSEVPLVLVQLLNSSVTTPRFNAEWSGPESAVVFEVIQYVPAAFPVDIVLPSATGVLLPPQGVRTNQSTLTVQTDAREGRVIPTEIEQTQPVGSFMQSAGIRLVQPQNIVISFQPEMDLVLNEFVQVKLPAFSAPDFTNYGVFVEPPCLEAVWSAVNEMLRMRVNCSAITAGALVNVTLGPRTEMTLPSSGVRISDMGNFTIASNAFAGPVPTTPLSTVPLIGYVISSRTQFRSRFTDLPPQASAAADILIFVSFGMDVTAGDTILLYLPGFTGADEMMAVAGASNGALNFNARWHPNAPAIPTLGLTLEAGSVLAGNDIEVTVPWELGIALPFDGVR
eukprot:1345234-Rhodomonas_salina.1